MASSNYTHTFNNIVSWWHKSVPNTDIPVIRIYDKCGTVFIWEKINHSILVGVVINDLNLKNKNAIKIDKC